MSKESKKPLDDEYDSDVGSLSSISDHAHSPQCKFFEEQGGVERLSEFLSEDSPNKHRELASLIMENVQAWQNRQNS